MSLLPAIGLGLTGLSALGGLFGHKGGNAAGYLRSVNQNFGPNALNADYQRLFSMLASSPSFQSQLSGINLAGQNLSQGLASSFANRGLTSSGVGTIAQNLGNATGGFESQRAIGSLSSDALNAAQQNLLARLQAWSSLTGQSIGQPSPFGSIFGSLLSAGGPALAQYFAGKGQQNPWPYNGPMQGPQQP